MLELIIKEIEHRKSKNHRDDIVRNVVGLTKIRRTYEGKSLVNLGGQDVTLINLKEGGTYMK